MRNRIISAILVAVLFITSFTTLGFAANSQSDSDTSLVVNGVATYETDKNNEYVFNYKTTVLKTLRIFSLGDYKTTLTVNYKGLDGKSKSNVYSANGYKNNFLAEISFIGGINYELRIKAETNTPTDLRVVCLDKSDVASITVTGIQSAVYTDGVNIDLNNIDKSKLDLSGFVATVLFNKIATPVILTGNEIFPIIDEIAADGTDSIKLTTFKYGKIIQRSESLNLHVTPYPFASMILSTPPTRKTYTYGVNGRISGTLSDHVFYPAFELDGAEITVKYSDTYKLPEEKLPVLKDGNGYYIQTAVGKIEVVANGVCNEDSGNFKAVVTAGKPLNPEMSFNFELVKPGFFERIAIFFRLLFGMYK